MNNRSMMNIHIDALAFAAGVPSQQHLAVSHAPYYPKPPRHRLRRLSSRILRIVATLSERLASRLEPGPQQALLKHCIRAALPAFPGLRGT